MFDHSIRVPRLYKLAGKIGKEVQEGKGSIKQLVYGDKKHPNVKAIYSLVVHCFQKSEELARLLKKSKLLENEPRLDPWLAKILITELLWGKKRLASEAKPIKTVLAYEQVLRAHLSDDNDQASALPENVLDTKPRYVRVNTIKISVEDAIAGFSDEGWIFKRLPDSAKKNYEEFLELVSSLQPEEFMADVHIEDLLIFPPRTTFYSHPAYQDGRLILQDKASCFPAKLLNPQPGSIVLDMCAAPGMKTTQLAATIKNQGKIIAAEKSTKRFEVLKTITEQAGATCVVPVNQDVLTIINSHYPGIEYVLVDPSCSGSGISDRVETGQQDQDQENERILKLAGFQIKILRHALTKYPKAKRVVYSTCSLFPEENEDVVRQVLESCTSFKLVPAGPFLNHNWINYGSPMFGDIGTYCLYAKPEIDLTSGFFVAVFERLEEGDINKFMNTNLVLYEKSMQRKQRKKLNKMLRLNEMKSKGEEVSESYQYEEQYGQYGRRRRSAAIKEESAVAESNCDNYEEIAGESVKTGTDECFAEEVSTGEKKRKKKAKQEKVDEDADVKIKNEGQEDEKLVKKDKKKKRKELLQSEEQMGIKAEAEMETNSPKKKKSKKNKEAKLELAEDPNQSLLEKPKKKKKKDENSVSLDGEKDHSSRKKIKREEERMNLDENDEPKKKKDKKHKKVQESYV